MSSGLKVAIVGATGAVGQDLIETLEAGMVEIAEWRLIARTSSSQTSMHVAGEERPILALPVEASRSALFENIDLVIFAVPAGVTREWMPHVQAQGVAAIDVGAALYPDMPLLVPQASLEPLDRIRETRVASSPSAAAVLLSSALAPFQDLGLVGACGTVLISAGVFGRKGPEELSQQVVSLFNGSEPVKQLFAKGLAFDVETQIGPAEHGWSGSEMRLSGELGAVLSMDPRTLRMTQMVVPIFSGIVAQLHVQLEYPVDLDTVAERLHDAPFIQLADPLPGPRTVVGQSQAYLGRLRPDPLGAGFHLTLVADNLRLGASANTMAIILALKSRGII